MTQYLNMKTSYGVETVDQLDSEDFTNNREFRKELKRLINEYRLSGMIVYSSSRCDKSWKEWLDDNQTKYTNKQNRTAQTVLFFYLSMLYNIYYVK